MSVPLFIYCFNLSLRDATSFEQLETMLTTPYFKVVLTVLAWAIGHHMLAGVRFLLTEIDIATSLDAAKRFAWIVNVSGVIIFLLAGYFIWI